MVWSLSDYLNLSTLHPSLFNYIINLTFPSASELFTVSPARDTIFNPFLLHLYFTHTSGLTQLWIPQGINQTESNPISNPIPNQILLIVLINSSYQNYSFILMCWVSWLMSSFATRFQGNMKTMTMTISTLSIVIGIGEMFNNFCTMLEWDQMY